MISHRIGKLTYLKLDRPEKYILVKLVHLNLIPGLFQFSDGTLSMSLPYGVNINGQTTETNEDAL